MKKQELVHVHGLIAEVTEYCEEREAGLELDDYLAQETRPTSIHHGKEDHKEAVFELANAITSAVAEPSKRSTTAEGASAD